MVAVRAKTTPGKKALDSSCDNWLAILIDMVLFVHDRCWMEDDHFGKETTRDG